MQASTRVVFNTVILYLKVVLSLTIALVSVPLVLKALGASDYGLYNLVAGIVTMLAFLNNAMTVSSQRYMSVAMGENNEDKINIIFNTSFLLHLILGIFVVIVFEIIGIFAIDRLNIPSDRIWCAKVIYQFLILSTFLKIIAVPFDALINAKEDMVPLSIIELIDSVLMLIIAFTVPYVYGDKLIFYGLGILIIAIVTLILKFSWCSRAYSEYKIRLKSHKGKFHLKSMLGFTGWNLFGGLAMIGRNQGVAVIINLFLGTVANAAYGVANQINGALSHFSSTFQKAINPQLMKSEGMNDRNRLLRISLISSKFSVLAIAFFAVPLIIEMEGVLHIWLKDNIPPYTLRLAQLILILSIAYQYSTGIMSAIQASGRIRNYQIIVGSILLLNIPLAFCILILGYPIHYILVGFIILEIISLGIRLIMAGKLIGMRHNDFFRIVFLPTFLNILIPTVACLVPYFLMTQSFIRIIVVGMVYCSIFLIMMFKLALNESQRNQITAHIKKIFSRQK